jgi:predicted ABC-type ATPase
MLVVAGPPGSGKSRALPLEDTGVAFFNVDDRCYKLNNGSYHGIPREVRERANAECQRFVDDHIGSGKRFGLETTLRKDITFDQGTRARARGFAVYMEYVAAGSPEESIRRVAIRADGCGHAAPESLIRQAYAASVKNLPRAIREFDAVTVYDNARRGTPEHPPRLVRVLRAERGRITWVVPSPPRWLGAALEGTEYAFR